MVGILARRSVPFLFASFASRLSADPDEVAHALAELIRNGTIALQSNGLVVATSHKTRQPRGRKQPRRVGKRHKKL